MIFFTHKSTMVRACTGQQLHLLLDEMGADAVFRAGPRFTSGFLKAVSKLSLDAAAEVRSVLKRKLTSFSLLFLYWSTDAEKCVCVPTESMDVLSFKNSAFTKTSRNSGWIQWKKKIILLCRKSCWRPAGNSRGADEETYCWQTGMLRHWEMSDFCQCVIKYRNKIWNLRVYSWSNNSFLLIFIREARTKWFFVNTSWADKKPYLYLAINFL